MSTTPSAHGGPSPAHTGNQWSDQRIEQVIGNLLRLGVFLSAAVVLLGGVIYLYTDGSLPAPPPHLTRAEDKQPEVRRALDIVADAGRFHSTALIELGLLLLIATPIARVVFSVFAFAIQRDRLYVVITLLVLGILLYSLFSGHLS
jgi:uncharacterized membrane protein